MDVVSTQILAQIKDIDFRCDFECGVCVGMRSRKEQGIRDIGKICCRNCHHYVGYLRIKEKDLPEDYKEYFTNPDGFWEDGGCKLPKEMRSRRCLIYTCSDSNISDEDRVILKRLEEET